MKFYPTILLLILLLSGCAPRLQVQAPELILPGESSANVVVMRNFNIYGGAIRYWVTVDDKVIVALGTNQHTELPVATGNHSVGVKWFGGWKVVFLNQRAIDETLEKEKTYYYLLSPTALGNTEIERIGEREAKQRLKSS